MKVGIVLSGGGAKGSWQVGVLQYLAEHDILPDGIDFVSGTSVGALNSAAIAMYPKSRFQLSLAHAKLMDVWGQLEKSEQIWTKRWPPYLTGLWYKSIGRNDGLRKILTKHFDADALRESGVQWRVSGVDLLRGELRYFGEGYPDPIAAMMASSSFPLAFPPEEIGGSFYTDGGIMDIAPLRPAIHNGCDRIIVLVCRNPHKIAEVQEGDINNVAKLGMRCLALMEHELLREDLARCERANQRIRDGVVTDKRLLELDILYPSEPLASSLDFSGNIMRDQMAQGYQDAKDYFEAG